VKRHNGHLINFVNQEIILSKKKQHRNNIFVYCNYNKTVKKSWRETKGVIRSRKSKDRQYNGQGIGCISSGYTGNIYIIFYIRHHQVVMISSNIELKLTFT
jgi:hypothetical protein